jgi:hypothetical protein
MTAGNEDRALMERLNVLISVRGFDVWTELSWSYPSCPVGFGSCVSPSGSQTTTQGKVSVACVCVRDGGKVVGDASGWLWPWFEGWRINDERQRFKHYLIKPLSAQVFSDACGRLSAALREILSHL